MDWIIKIGMSISLAIASFTTGLSSFFHARPPTAETEPATSVVIKHSDQLKPAPPPVKKEPSQGKQNATITVSAALKAKAGVNANAIAQAMAKGPVMIIVQLKPPTTAGYVTLGTDGEDMQAILRENKAAEEAVVKEYFGDPATLTGPDRALRMMPISTSFRIVASAKEVEALAKDSRVLTIEADVLGGPSTVQ